MAITGCQGDAGTSRGVLLNEDGSISVTYADCGMPVRTVELFDQDEQLLWQAAAEETAFHAAAEIGAEAPEFRTVVPLEEPLDPEATYQAGANTGPPHWGPRFRVEELRRGRVLDGRGEYLTKSGFIERGIALCEDSLSERLSIAAGWMLIGGAAATFVSMWVRRMKRQDATEA